MKGFFKVYIPEFSSKIMELPLAFAQRTEGILPDKAFLRDRYGSLWPVTLARIGNRLYFTDGWTKFIEDNTIEVGEFLVFQFDGTNTFDVKLFGRSACEKAGLGALKPDVKLETVEECTQIDNITRDDDDDDDDDEKVEDEEYVEEEEEEEEQKLREISITEMPKAKRLRSSQGIRKFSKGTKTRSKRAAIDRESARDVYGAEIFRSGLYIQPKNPYFVTQVRKSRRYELYIPVHVIKSFQLELPPTLTLRDPQGRTYASRLKPWKDGRTWYTGGWWRLCKVNLIGVEDTCICEFVKVQGQKDLILDIQTVRPGATSK